MLSSATEGVFATLPNAQRGVPLVINGDPKGKNMLYCNGKVVVIRDIEVRNVNIVLALTLLI